MSDVAEKAGVAVSTVSRVINRSPLVAAARRKEIEAIIKELGYAPSAPEKRKGVRKDPTPWIKHQMVKTILFGDYDLSWITNYAPIYAYALHGIEESLRSHGFGRSVEPVATAEELIQLLNQGGADGFLILNTGQTPLPKAIVNYPVVALLGRHDYLTCDRVTTDANFAGRLAAEYLLEKGCRHFIAISGETPVYRARVRAFCDCLDSSNQRVIDVHEQNIERGRPHSHRANCELITERLRPNLTGVPKPLGIFSSSDMITSAIYLELARSELKIGEDVHVVSCNNERPYIESLHPFPAAIDVRANYIGRRAVEQLLRRLEYPDAPPECVNILPMLLSSETD